jgi:hypothetical protein
MAQFILKSGDQHSFRDSLSASPAAFRAMTTRHGGDSASEEFARDILPPEVVDGQMPDAVDPGCPQEFGMMIPRRPGQPCRVSTPKGRLPIRWIVVNNIVGYSMYVAERSATARGPSGFGA